MEWALGAEKKPRIDDAKLVIGKDSIMTRMATILPQA